MATVLGKRRDGETKIKREKFQKLFSVLNISNDDFIRTSDKKKHWKGVEKLWEKIKENKDISETAIMTLTVGDGITLTEASGIVTISVDQADIETAFRFIEVTNGGQQYPPLLVSIVQMQ